MGFKVFYHKPDGQSGYYRVDVKLTGLDLIAYKLSDLEIIDFIAPHWRNKFHTSYNVKVREITLETLSKQAPQLNASLDNIFVLNDSQQLKGFFAPETRRIMWR
ncbi:hypothetical protein HYV79_03640 [Candidatus Woesearchaeota archaeon]|nr:hypothetical protein [Candidatus Woesearchaeota archaeon]